MSRHAPARGGRRDAEQGQQRQHEVPTKVRISRADAMARRRARPPAADPAQDPAAPPPPPNAHGPVVDSAIVASVLRQLCASRASSDESPPLSPAAPASTNTIDNAAREFPRNNEASPPAAGSPGLGNAASDAPRRADPASADTTRGRGRKKTTASPAHSPRSASSARATVAEFTSIGRLLSRHSARRSSPHQSSSTRQRCWVAARTVSCTGVREHRGVFIADCVAGRRAGTHEPVAVKVMPLTPESSHTFQHECKIHRLASGHPNIVGLLDAFQANVCASLPLSLPPTRCRAADTLSSSSVSAARCSSRSSPVRPPHRAAPTDVPADQGLRRELLVHYATQLLEAVAYLHSKGIWHLDIKTEARPAAPPRGR